MIKDVFRSRQFEAHVITLACGCRVVFYEAGGSIKEICQCGEFEVLFKVGRRATSVLAREVEPLYFLTDLGEHMVTLAELPYTPLL